MFVLLLLLLLLLYEPLAWFVGVASVALVEKSALVFVVIAFARRRYSIDVGARFLRVERLGARDAIAVELELHARDVLHRVSAGDRRRRARGGVVGTNRRLDESLPSGEAAALRGTRHAAAER